MVGLKNITDKILSDAKAKADKILKDADKSADAVLFDAKTEADRLKSMSNAKLTEYEKTARDNINAALRMKEKEALLKTEQTTVYEIVLDAKETILNLSDSEYFELLADVLKKVCEDKEGELLLAEKDIKRMPKNFAENFLEKLRLSEDNALSGGFIIRYGKVEQNCTLDAIFRSMQGRFLDIVATALRG